MMLFYDDNDGLPVGRPRHTIDRVNKVKSKSHLLLMSLG
jgi:hypothetical protein